ncbi:methyltransferase [Nocardioides sp.]|uniref:methyltransferase n=1 Tax=Nocardioides sp. TaxID=35761 RepID=UPI0035280193
MPASDRATSDRALDRASERRSLVRTGVVWEALRRALAAPGAYAEQRASIVDLGGGTGGFAVPLAELGHRVLVVDPSPDALAALGRRAAEHGVTDLVTGVQGDVAELPTVVGEGQVDRPADLVLCHGVLEGVEDPAAALAAVHEVLRPGGALSLLVAQRHAAVIARAMAGHFQQARTLLDTSPPPDPSTRGAMGHRFTAEELTALVETDWEVEALHGIRVFADLVPGSLLDLEPGATAALAELEQAVAERPEYLPLAAQLHLLARRR